MTGEKVKLKKFVQITDADISCPSSDAIRELIDRIIDSYDELARREVLANTVVLNGKKYGLFIKPGFRPSIIGLDVELANLPDDWDFVVQKREPEPKTESEEV